MQRRRTQQRRKNLIFTRFSTYYNKRFNNDKRMNFSTVTYVIRFLLMLVYSPLRLERLLLLLLSLSFSAARADLSFFKRSGFFCCCCHSFLLAAARATLFFFCCSNHSLLLEMERLLLLLLIPLSFSAAVRSSSCLHKQLD